jgi:hypothetical protein
LIIPDENSEQKQTTIDERIDFLYLEGLRGKHKQIDWDILQTRVSVLSNGLLALGIGRNVENFVDEAFNEFRPDTITLATFKEKLKGEWKNSKSSHNSPDGQISKLYSDILQEKEKMDWDILRKNSAILSKSLVALGIKQTANELIETAFKDFKPKIIPLQIFKEKLKEEWKISSKMAWLAQTNVLRCVAKALAPPNDENDPLSGLLDLNKQDIIKLFQNIHHDIADCLFQYIDAILKAKCTVGSEVQKNNGKFCVDPTLFTAKCAPSIFLIAEGILSKIWSFMANRHLSLLSFCRFCR